MSSSTFDSCRCKISSFIACFQWLLNFLNISSFVPLHLRWSHYQAFGGHISSHRLVYHVHQSIPFLTSSFLSSHSVFPEQEQTVLSLSQTPALLAITPTNVFS